MSLSLVRHAPRIAALGLLVLVAACSSDKPPVQDFDEFMAQQEAAKSKWTESAFTLPTGAPQDADIAGYSTSPNDTLAYGIDVKSVTVTDDGVVRYVSVIRSKQGARNLTYEGLHCSTFETRLYATGSPDGKWTPARVSEWRPIRPYGPTGYQGVLYRDFLCNDKGPAGNAKAIVQNLRFPKPMDATSR